MPAPPGTQIRSSCGHSAKVMVGVICMPPPAVTGSRVFQIRCTLASGNLMNTSYGPVMSSWVMSGKSSRPMWKGMGSSAPRIALQ